MCWSLYTSHPTPYTLTSIHDQDYQDGYIIAKFNLSGQSLSNINNSKSNIASLGANDETVNSVLNINLAKVS